MKRTMIFAWISKTKRILFFSIVKKKIAINWRDKFHLRLVTFDGLSLEHWNIAMHHSASKMFAFCCKSLRCISCSKLYASQVAVRYDWAKSGCFFFRFDFMVHKVRKWFQCARSNVTWYTRWLVFDCAIHHNSCFRCGCSEETKSNCILFTPNPN